MIACFSYIVWTPTDTIEESRCKHSKPDLNLVVGGCNMVQLCTTIDDDMT